MKFRILLLSLIGITGKGVAQKIPQQDVPPNIIQVFETKFPSAEVRNWQHHNGKDFEVKFTVNDKNQSAIFDALANCLQTEIELTFEQLPPQIKLTMNKQFHGYKLTLADQVNDAIHGECYQLELVKGDMIYDVVMKGSGELISKTAENDKDID